MLPASSRLIPERLTQPGLGRPIDHQLHLIRFVCAAASGKTARQVAGLREAKPGSIAWRVLYEVRVNDRDSKCSLDLTRIPGQTAQRAGP